MRCNKCGRAIKVSEGKFCPFCGDTYEDEMRAKIDRAFPYQRKVYIGILVVAVIVLATTFGAVWSSRHYAWTEKVQTTVADKDHYTTSYTTCDWYTTDANGHRYCASYSTHYDDHYIIICKDSHRDEVYYGTWESTTIGDNWTYDVWHYDWKPGMENSPIPSWVYIIPLGIALTGVASAFTVVWSKRHKEMKEWKEKGDLKIDGEKDDSEEAFWTGNKSIRKLWDNGDDDE